MGDLILPSRFQRKLKEKKRQEARELKPTQDPEDVIEVSREATSIDPDQSSLTYVTHKEGDLWQLENFLYQLAGGQSVKGFVAKKVYPKEDPPLTRLFHWPDATKFKRPHAGILGRYCRAWGLNPEDLR